MKRRWGGTAGGDRACAASGGRVAPAYAQERLWFLEQLGPGNVAYNIAGGVRVRGEVRREVVEQAVQALVARHEAMRTVFEERGGVPVQVVKERMEVKVEEAAAGDWEEALGLARAEGRRKFDLGSGPLLRVKVVRVGAGEQAIVFTLHHIISDGWSMGVMVREFGELYNGYVRGEVVALGELKINIRTMRPGKKDGCKGKCWRSNWDIGGNGWVERRYWNYPLTV